MIQLVIDHLNPLGAELCIRVLSSGETIFADIREVFVTQHRGTGVFDDEGFEVCEDHRVPLGVYLHTHVGLWLDDRDTYARLNEIFFVDEWLPVLAEAWERDREQLVVIQTQLKHLPFHLLFHSRDPATSMVFQRMIFVYADLSEDLEQGEIGGFIGKGRALVVFQDDQCDIGEITEFETTAREIGEALAQRFTSSLLPSSRLSDRDWQGIDVFCFVGHVQKTPQTGDLHPLGVGGDSISGIDLFYRLKALEVRVRCALLLTCLGHVTGFGEEPVLSLAEAFSFTGAQFVICGQIELPRTLRVRASIVRLADAMGNSVVDVPRTFHQIEWTLGCSEQGDDRLFEPSGLIVLYGGGGSEL